MHFENHYRCTSLKWWTLVDETLARVSIETRNANETRQNVSVHVSNESRVEDVARKETVLDTWHNVATFLQLREEEQYLFEKKPNTLSTRVVYDLVLNLVTNFYEKGLKSLVILVLEKSFADLPTRIEFAHTPFILWTLHNVCHTKLQQLYLRFFKKSPFWRVGPKAEDSSFIIALLKRQEKIWRYHGRERLRQHLFTNIV